MNYLGHAFLSFGDRDILTGNMVADEVKGRAALSNYPARIRQGIELHRSIDAETDRHPAALRARLLFREHYRLYAGPVTDVVMDHFLASDVRCFPSEGALKQFSQHTYAQLEENRQWFPETFSRYFEHMRTHDWLSGYASVKGVERALTGLARRASKMPPPEKAYEVFITNYYSLNQCFYELIDWMIDFVKNETERLNN